MDRRRRDAPPAGRRAPGHRQDEPPPPLTDVLVLCYHAVSEDWRADLSVRPRALEEQITRLLQLGYTPTTFTEAVTGSSDRRRLAVTFDDAFASVQERAKPILDRLGIPGTIFAVTDFADTGRPLMWQGIDDWSAGPHDDELRGLSWDALRELADDGWEVGSHTCDHPRLTQLSDAELDRQMTESRLACERGMRRPCTSIAYPYGDLDARVEAAAERAGYTAAAALPANWPRPRPMSWPRVGVYHGDSLRRFSVKASRTVRVLRSPLAFGRRTLRS